jgi:membrane fusion protein (multidrug efflux system)
MENNETKKPKKKTLPLIMGTIILIGVVYGIIKYRYSLHHEVTDDAQIEGDISPVLARVTGYVKEIRFEDNQQVRKGDTLVLLDDNDLKIKLAQAEAALANAQAGIGVAQANISTARATEGTSSSGIDAAKVRLWKANQDFTRYQNLLADQAVTEQQFEAVKAEKESAEAQLKIASGQESTSSVSVNAAEKQLGVAQSLIAQRQADVDYAKLQLSYSVITAPATGYASRKNIQPGQLVNAGSPLFSIVSDSGLYVIANFKETQLEKMQRGQNVEINIDAFSSAKFSGKVYAFSPATGAKFSLLPPDNATGNFVKVVQRLPVKITLEAGKDMQEKLHPGMSVKVAVNTD